MYIQIITLMICKKVKNRVFEYYTVTYIKTIHTFNP
ncbi:Uncharacterised protein [Klebsiella pneumoniae]|nr:hypothetical protein KPNIH2_27195 [Klebsiella pneumoniae subsp. pneumoniae KPNIH2]EJJ32981.1 hypothetical protein KPNIH4_27081 [Klebsiella pneumoniae subsp. pneumoniae KPNIH4]EJJ48961.1 hypothetical protein KPNIH6_27696 [Klebsiella pneumoniae subsp. pneumoniae KPNIH6]EJJ50604.1 hypothetical protein KPNIH7_27662 [Klebsiella pneumoniae subsp. pneumoniae KPNIH7]EJJ65633.1 hypothetical protein KPNIH8_28192 [Klebsiella pneumoniae subsp. pneumoniae KPNIH8]EJJ65761.1 hypothetical protein KPNIH9_27